MIKIAALVGETESGKDTIADFAIKHFDARQIAFASKIRECALAINPIVTITVAAEGGPTPPDQITVYRLSDVVSMLGWREAKKLPEVRQLLQRIGTEMGRELIHNDLWINLGFGRLVAYHQGSNGELNNFVITDVRFQNEADKIMEFVQMIQGACHFVRVTRPGYGAVNGHASESSYDQINPIHDHINNDGTLDDLEGKVVDILGKFFNS